MKNINVTNIVYSVTDECISV